MSGVRHDLLERFGAAAYQPVTFLDRGVTVPFTTPFLLGARIRPTEARSALELVIANPGGGRGFYIVPWAALPDICCPTLHDRRLWQRLSEKTGVTPSLVRDTARAVAAEGLAGRAAARAVADARSAESAACLRANFLLLLDLIRRTETGAEAAIPPEADSPPNVELRGRRAVARIAAHVGVPAESVAAWLEALAGAVAGVGVPGDRTASRTREMVARLEALVRDIATCVARLPDPGEHHAARLVTDAAGLSLRCAGAAFADLDGVLADTPALLRAWRDDSAAVARRATRPDWLLDGWGMIAELWRDAEPAMRQGALWEMALLAPVMPREVEDWLDIEEDWERPVRLRRLVRANEDWRSGRMMEVIARNERLRAREA